MSQSVEYLDNTAEEENYSQLISEFVSTNPQYYESRFEKIGAKTGFSWTFNIGAALLGPVWYGMRSLWSWGLPFLLLEIFAWIQIARGTFGNLAADAQERITQIEGTLEFRSGSGSGICPKNCSCRCGDAAACENNRGVAGKPDFRKTLFQLAFKPRN